MKTIIALLAFSGLFAASVSALSYQPLAAPHAQDVRWTPAAFEAPESTKETITVADVVITAKRPARKVAAKHQDAQCGAFNYRPVTQGPATSTVRGFCL